MRMCCCWSYQPWPTLRWSQSWLDLKSQIEPWAWWPRGCSQRQPQCGDKLILELSCLGCCSNLPHKLNDQAGKGGKTFLSERWPCGGEEILPWQCQRLSPQHTEGQHSPIQHSRCACQFQCQRTLYLGPLAHGTDARSQLPTAVVPTATYGELHLVSSRLPICLCNLSNCTMEIPTETVAGQVAPANQVPPVVILIRTSKQSNDKPQKGWVLGGPEPPRPQRMAWTGAEAGQRTAAQMGTPVWMQWPGPGQSCSDQA